MGNNRSSKLFPSENGLYLWIIAFLVLLLTLFEPLLGIAGLGLLGYLNFHNWRQGKQRSKRWQKYIESLSSDIDSAARYAILNLPIPLTLVDLDGKISWYNSKFSEMVDKKDILGQDLKSLVPQMDVEDIIEDDDVREIRLGDRYYHVLHNLVKLGDEEDDRLIMMLYWIDQTEFVSVQEKYDDERPIVALVQVDNYDDVLNDSKEEKRPVIKAEIDQKIKLWATRMNGLMKKFGDDKYLVIFESKFLENLEAKRFTILDELREIEVGNRFPITLSIGVGVNGRSFSQLEEHAYSSLELALGRGGDQAVVRKKGNFEFYGGKTKAVEKRNRVKARVIAHAFRPLIDESSKVFIMGHKYPDMDAFGAAIGVYRAVMNRGKDGYIVLNEVNESILNVYNVFGDDPNYKFITTEEALELLDFNTLLVVVDTHRPSFTEAPELLDSKLKVVLFDHHRRGTEFIDNAVLKYTEPYASSTSELVTEILQYMENNMYLNKQEAEALLAGITVDTKSFTFKTGVRTFEAASLLRRFGADTTAVRQLFQDDLSTFIHKSQIVSSATIYNNEIAISVYADDIPNAQLVAAQSADALLNIRGITTSFVIGRKLEGEVFISGRSLGDVNVQVVLEKIGGGGHMEVAGAQFRDKSMDEVKDLLIEAINAYVSEEGE